MTRIPPRMFTQTEPRIELEIDCPNCEGSHTIEAPEIFLSMTLEHDDCGGKMEDLVLAWSDVEVRTLDEEPSFVPNDSDNIQI